MVIQYLTEIQLTAYIQYYNSLIEVSENDSKKNLIAFKDSCKRELISRQNGALM